MEDCHCFEHHDLLSGLLRFVTDTLQPGGPGAPAMVRVTAACCGETSELWTKRSGNPPRSAGSRDIVRLRAGDMIPADVRLLSSKDLFVSQSMMTGEAHPVGKFAEACDPKLAHNALDLGNIAYLVVPW